MSEVPPSSPSVLKQEGLIILDDLYHTDYLEAGGEAVNYLALMNTNAEPLQVKVYPQDFIFNLKDHLLFVDPGLLRRSNARWIHAEYTFLELPPYAACPFKYTIRVPNDPSLEGSYWSVLMLESAEAPGTFLSPDGTELKAIKRYAFQIVTQIGKGECNLRILDRRIELLNNMKQLICDLENTGTLSLRLIPSIDLFSAGGESLGTLTGAQRLLHPGCSAKFDIDVSSLKRGLYKARLSFENEKVKIFSTEYWVEIPEALSGESRG